MWCLSSFPSGCIAEARAKTCEEDWSQDRKQRREEGPAIGRKEGPGGRANLLVICSRLHPTANGHANGQAMYSIACCHRRSFDNHFQELCLWIVSAGCGESSHSDVCQMSPPIYFFVNRLVEVGRKRQPNRKLVSALLCLMLADKSA